MERTSLIAAAAAALLLGTIATDASAELDENAGIFTAQIREEGSSISWGQAVIVVDTNPGARVRDHVLITDSVNNGTVSVFGDGRFNYTPDAGFVGTDRFRYAAYDYVDPSNPVWVTLRVVSTSGVPGDFDGDGERDIKDVDLLSAAIQGSQDLVFDINQDDTVDFDDLEHLIHNVFVTTFGDTNLDGQFTSIDIIRNTQVTTHPFLSFDSLFVE